MHRLLCLTKTLLVHRRVAPRTAKATHHARLTMAEPAVEGVRIAPNDVSQIMSAINSFAAPAPAPQPLAVAEAVAAVPPAQPMAAFGGGPAPVAAVAGEAGAAPGSTQVVVVVGGGRDGGVCAREGAGGM